MAGPPERESVAIIIVSGVGNERPGSARDMMVTTLLADPDERWRSSADRTVRLTAVAASGAGEAGGAELRTGEGSPGYREVFDVAAAEVSGAPGTPNLHVYEMYWADLSRAQGAVSRVFYLLMAITLQLSTIGLEAVRRFLPDRFAQSAPEEVVEQATTLRWLHRTMNAVSYWMVYAITPITLTMITLLMTLNAQLLIPEHAPDWLQQRQWVWVWVVGGLGTVAAWWVAGRVVRGGWTFHRLPGPAAERERSTNREVWLTCAVIAAAIAAGSVALVAPRLREALFLAAAAGAIVALSLMVDLVNPTARGSDELATRVLAIRIGFALAPFGATLFAAHSASAGRTANLLAMVSLRIDRAAWLVLLAACFVVALIAGWFRCGPGDGDEKRRLSMSVNVTLVLGPLLFAFATTAVFVFFSFLSTLWPGGYPAEWTGGPAPAFPQGGIVTAGGAVAAGSEPVTWGRAMIDQMTPPLGLALCLAGALVVALLAAASAYVISLVSRNRLRPGAPIPSGDEVRQRLHGAATQGTAFDRILRFGGSGWMFFLTSIAWSGLALAAALAYWIPIGMFQHLFDDRVRTVAVNAGYWAVLVLVVAAAAAVGLSSAGWVKYLGRPIAKVLTAALDVVYDIASYLRTGQPGIVAPRIQMVARYRALLTHLAQVDYDRVVICAHSQGTQLTYATLAGDPDRLPPLQRAAVLPRNIELVTYGSPLTQTYRRRLPRQFAAMGPPLPVEALRRHVNLYRAGDYIGRSLLAPQGPTDPTTATGAGAFSERCLGKGHHTGYGADERWRAAVRSLIVHRLPYTAADLPVAGLDASLPRQNPGSDPSIPIPNSTSRLS